MMTPDPERRGAHAATRGRSQHARQSLRLCGRAGRHGALEESCLRASPRVNRDDKKEVASRLLGRRVRPEHVRVIYRSPCRRNAEAGRALSNARPGSPRPVPKGLLRGPAQPRLPRRKPRRPALCSWSSTSHMTTAIRGSIASAAGSYVPARSSAAHAPAAERERFTSSYRRSKRGHLALTLLVRYNVRICHHVMYNITK